MEAAIDQWIQGHPYLFAIALFGIFLTVSIAIAILLVRWAAKGEGLTPMEYMTKYQGRRNAGWREAPQERNPLSKNHLRHRR